jgi:16S rRNA C1402 N4-methylase RsmH
MVVSTSYHLPVLLPEVLLGLKVEKGKKYIDATLGGGGYAFEILKRGGIVLGIDWDDEAIEYVRKKLEGTMCHSESRPLGVGTKDPDGLTGFFAPILIGAQNDIV